MKIDRYAVNLFLEIKRNLPHGIGHTLKIANPEIEKNMGEIYNSIEDEAVKCLIEVFIEHINSESHKSGLEVLNKKSSGTGFFSSLSKVKGRHFKNSRMWNLIPKNDSPILSTKKNTQSYYRGVLVEEQHD